MSRLWRSYWYGSPARKRCLMKPSATTGLPGALVAQLDPGRVQEYARAAGWTHEPRLGKGTVGVYERADARLRQLRIPLTRDLADFDVLMTEAVAYLADWEKRPALE